MSLLHTSQQMSPDRHNHSGTRSRALLSSHQAYLTPCEYSGPSRLSRIRIMAASNNSPRSACAATIPNSKKMPPAMEQVLSHSLEVIIAKLQTCPHTNFLSIQRHSKQSASTATTIYPESREGHGSCVHWNVEGLKHLSPVVATATCATATTIASLWHPIRRHRPIPP